MSYGLDLVCRGAYLASLVLGDLVLGVLPAVLALAVRPAGFRNVDLCDQLGSGSGVAAVLLRRDMWTICVGFAVVAGTLVGKCDVAVGPGRRV